MRTITLEVAEKQISVDTTELSDILCALHLVVKVGRMEPALRCADLYSRLVSVVLGDTEQALPAARAA